MLQVATDFGSRPFAFVLGAQLPPGLPLEQRSARARDPTYWATYTAIEQFGEHPDAASEPKAKDTLENASQKAWLGFAFKILQLILEDPNTAPGDRDS